MMELFAKIIYNFHTLAVLEKYPSYIIDRVLSTLLENL